MSAVLGHHEFHTIAGAVARRVQGHVGESWRALYAKHPMSDLTPRFSDLDLRLVLADGADASTWKEAYRAAGAALLDLLHASPRWGNAIQEPPGYNYTPVEISRHQRWHFEPAQWELLAGDELRVRDDRGGGFEARMAALGAFASYYQPYDPALDVPINVPSMDMADYRTYSSTIHYFLSALRFLFIASFSSPPPLTREATLDCADELLGRRPALDAIRSLVERGFPAGEIQRWTNVLAPDALFDLLQETYYGCRPRLDALAGTEKPAVSRRILRAGAKEALVEAVVIYRDVDGSHVVRPILRDGRWPAPGRIRITERCRRLARRHGAKVTSAWTVDETLTLLAAGNPLDLYRLRQGAILEGELPARFKMAIDEQLVLSHCRQQLSNVEAAGRCRRELVRDFLERTPSWFNAAKICDRYLGGILFKTGHRWLAAHRWLEARELDDPSTGGYGELFALLAQGSKLFSADLDRAMDLWEEFVEEAACWRLGADLVSRKSQSTLAEIR